MGNWLSLWAVLRGEIDGRIAPRSGLASKHFIDTGAGVIDADYRGEVKVLLFNHAESEFVVKEGERVAQLVLERVCLFPCFPLCCVVSILDLLGAVRVDCGRGNICGKGQSKDVG